MKRAKSQKVNFSQRWVQLLEPGERRQKFVDARVEGLGLVVQPTGVKSFYWTKKINGRAEFETLGQFPSLDVTSARAAATERNHRLAEWKTKKFEGENPFVQRVAATLDAVVDEYIERQIKPHAKHPEIAEKRLRRMVDIYLAPWRRLKLSMIRPDDVANLHLAIGKKFHRTANAVVKQLRSLFNFAVRARLYRGENPAKGIPFYRENRRGRFLQPDEIPRLLTALRRAPNPDLRDYVNIAMWSGARKSDILSMRWVDVSLDGNRWVIPDPKNRRPTTIALDSEVVLILKERLRRRKDNNPWIFPSVGRSGHVVDLKSAWKALLIDAKLHFPGDPVLRLTQHDLRRTLGAYLNASGASLPTIGAQLGHASLATTQAVYTPINISTLREVLEKTTSAMRALVPVAPKRRKAAARG
jgi:integrase